MPTPSMRRMISGAVDIAAKRERAESTDEMTYSTSWPATVTAAQAKREIRNHGVDWADFIADHGDLSQYSSTEVLGWLGY